MAEITNLDVWRSANLLIKIQGAEAAGESRKTAETLKTRGNIQGYELWLRVAQAIDWLQANPGADPMGIVLNPDPAAAVYVRGLR